MTTTAPTAYELYHDADEIEIPSATDDTDAYIKALLDTLGDQDPLEVMAQTTALVRAICTDVPLELLEAIPVPGEWSAAQTVGHIFDVDVVYGFRWRLVLTEDNPVYPGYDEKSWTGLPRLDFWAMLNAWEGLRASNIVLLRSLSDEDWQRTGVHGEQGPENIDVMIRKLAGHDLAHTDQIRRSVAAAAAAAAARAV